MKYGLKEHRAIKYFERDDILYEPIQADLVQNIMSASRERRKELLKKKEEKEQKEQDLKLKKRTVLSKRAATKLSAIKEKKARLDHQK